MGSHKLIVEPELKDVALKISSILVSFYCSFGFLMWFSSNFCWNVYASVVRMKGAKAIGYMYLMCCAGGMVLSYCVIVDCSNLLHP